MKYMSGEDVREDDVIIITNDHGGTPGVVRRLILPNTDDARDWSAPNGGVLIEGGGLGLSVTELVENDEHIVFVRRGS